MTKRTKASLLAAIADAIVLERTAQVQSQDMHARLQEAERRGFTTEARELRCDMDHLLADAAERMADRLREVAPHV